MSASRIIAKNVACSRIRTSIVKSQHNMMSIGNRLRKASFLSTNYQPSQTQSIQLSRRVTMLTNREKQLCIQEDIFELKGEVYTKKTFKEDHEQNFASFLEKIIDAKEKKNRHLGEQMDGLNGLEQEKQKKTEVKDDQIDSDLVPSSLESDYEQVKFELRKEQMLNSNSRTFAILSSDIRDAANKNHFNVHTLRRLDEQNSRKKCRWSGPDVLTYSLTNPEKAYRIVKMLNSVRIWPKRDGKNSRCLLQTRALGKRFSSHYLFENFMLLCVIFNTIVLAQDSHENQAYLDIYSQLNTAFTCMFSFELLLKVFSLGFKRFVRDPLNVVDAFIVIMSAVELTALMIYPGFAGQQSKSAISAFRVIRVFRVLRVLRMIRLLRQLQSMQIIIGVIQRSVKSFLYIAILLLLFIFIYAILGMQLFGKLIETSSQPAPLSRANFDTFSNAFLTIFFVLSNTNWNQYLYDTMYYPSVSVGGGQAGLGMKVAATLYYISFIILGNYILLNLFLAVLIDSFLKEGDQDQIAQRYEQNQKRELELLLNEKHTQKKQQRRESIKDPKKSFVRRQTISRPLFNLLSKINKEQSDLDLKRVNTSSFVSTIAALRNRVSVEQNGQTQLDLLIQNRLVEPNGSENLGILEDEIDQQERATIVQTLTTQMNYEMDFMTNQKLIDLSRGIIPLSNDAQGEEIFFKSTECEISFFLFTKSSKLRQIAMRFIRHRYFERAIILCIVLSSFKLALETYYLNYPMRSLEQRVFTAFDLVFTVIFTSEALLKMVSMGFVVERGTYLRRPENCLDFFIVVTSIVDNVISSMSRVSSLKQLKVFRLLRTLRPLRIVTHSQSMQNLVSTLIQSLSGIANVALLLLMVMTMFAILGDSLLSNRLIYCSSAKSQTAIYALTEASACKQAHGEWISYDLNFDTVTNGILTLIVVASRNNWDTLVFQAIDSSSESTGPIFQSNPGYAYFYVSFVLIGAFFFENFIIGVLFLNFKTVQKQRQLSLEEEKPSVLGRTRTQQEEEVRACWRDIQRMIVSAARPDIFDTAGQKRGVSTCRQRVQNLLAPGGRLDMALTACLLLNTLQMSLYYDGGSLAYTQTLDDINIAFTAVYAIEAGLKLWVYGCSGWILRYFQSGWNRFDFTVLLFSVLEVLLSNLLLSKLSQIKALPQIIRLLRVVRIVRILRLIGRFEGLQALISTIIFSMPQLLSVFLLLLILLFMFAILGVFLFSNVVTGAIINIQSGGFYGFTNFGHAMLTMYRCTTGEDWSNIMTDTLNPANCASGTNCISSFAVPFFVGFNTICSYVMLNVFVLIALEQFDRYYLPRDNVMARFRRDLVSFQDTWVALCDGARLLEARVPAFMKALKPPLGVQVDSALSSAAQEQQLNREVLRMGIRVDPNGFIHFHELLYRVMRRLYGQDPLLLELDMQLFELITQHRVQQKTDQELAQRKGSSLSKVLDSSRLATKSAIANPFLSQMTAKYAFKAWLNEARGAAPSHPVVVTYDVAEDVLISDDDSSCSSDESEEIKEPDENDTPKQEDHPKINLQAKSIQKRKTIPSF